MSKPELNIASLDTKMLSPQAVYAAIDDASKAVNLTIYRLCAETGVDYTTVNRWSRGDTEPSFRIVRSLLSFINKEAGKKND